MQISILQLTSLQQKMNEYLLIRLPMQIKKKYRRKIARESLENIKVLFKIQKKNSDTEICDILM